MQIIDVTSGVTLARNARQASNPWTRFRGLMLRRCLDEGEGLDIRGDSSIHMMFMRFPIDAVFYAEDGRVTRVRHSLRPWIGIAFGGRGTKGVVELPAGCAAGVEAGHELEFVA
ncbi:MAG: DUF192 domain-containing protein [Dehalococcoidia bacterium]